MLTWVGIGANLAYSLYLFGVVALIFWHGNSSYSGLVLIGLTWLLRVHSIWLSIGYFKIDANVKLATGSGQQYIHIQNPEPDST